MSSMRWFRGVVESVQDTTTGLRTMHAIGRGVREIRDAQMMQERGFASKPLKGEPALFLQADDLLVAVATESSDRPSLADGETVLYASAEVFIKLAPGGSIVIQGKAGTKVTMSPDGELQLEGKTIKLAGDQVDAISDLVNLGRETLTALDGVVTGSCFCAFTGGPHPDVSSSVRASKT